MENCTFNENTFVAGDVSIRQGYSQISNSIFKSTGDGTGIVIANQSSDLDLRYCAFNQEMWAQDFLPTVTAVGNVVVNHDQSSVKLAFVDPDAGDFRPRWDNVVLDKADPNLPLDFDLTRADIGWNPAYPVVEITGPTEITEPGHYLVTGPFATISGQNTELPDGTTVKMEDGSYLFIQDTDLAGGYHITVGDPDGARTAIVGPPSTGHILFGVAGTEIQATDCQFHGVLFNRVHAGASLQFRNCNVDLDGTNGNVVFNDFANGQLIFHEVCRGAFRNFDFTPPKPGIGSLSIIASDIDLLNVAFDPVPGGQNYGYWKVWQSGVAPGNPHQVIAGCTFLCNDNTYGVYPLFAQGAAFTLHHNQFTHIQQGAIYMYASTLDLANGAANIFSKPFYQDFNGNSIIIGWGGNVDLHCGYNSFTNDLITSPYKYFEAPCFSGDWRSNFWGYDCTTPLDPGPYLPTCVTNYLPTLSSCPSIFLPCEDQYEESPLYALGTEADADYNFEAACAYWTELMVEFPGSKYCTKVTGSMKAIGLVTEYGMESYGLIRSDLEAAAAQSEPVDFLLSVSQRCAAWCVEARHGDRPAALVLLNTLLLEVKGNLSAEKLINVAIAEIGTYPEQGGMSAMNPGMEIARLEWQTRQLRAFQLALLPEATQARIAQEGLTEAEQAMQPLDLRLIGCYPNPFNSATTIELVSRGDVPLTLEIYNLAGQRVTILQDGMLSAGNHRFQWDASASASGLYLVRAEQGTKQEISKLMLIR